MTKLMTHGSPIKLILMFMIPMMIGNIFQQFYSMADTIIVGRTLGVSALAAVGSTGPISFLLLGLSIGLSVGMSIVTAQKFGAHDLDGVRKSFTTSLILGTAMATLIMIIALISLRPMLVLLKIPAEILPDTYNYLFICILGSHFIMLYNLLGAMLRALGNSILPLVFLIIACITNVALDYIFILVFHMGVEGASLATVISEAVSCVLCIIYIRLKVPMLTPTKEDWKISLADIKAHLKVGLPVSFQWTIISFGLLAVQFALNILGTTAIAAFTAASKIDMIIAMPLGSISTTIATFTAQNFGAGKIDRIKKGVRDTTIVASVYCLFAILLLWLFGKQLSSIFVKDAPAVIDMAYEYLIITAFCYIFLSTLFIFRSAIQGVGNGTIPTVSGVIELALRLVGAFVFARLFGFVGVVLASPLAWAGACALLIPSYLTIINRLTDSTSQAESD